MMPNNKFTTKNLEANGLKMYSFDILSPYTKESETCQIVHKIGKNKKQMQEEYQNKIDTYYVIANKSEKALSADMTIDWVEVEKTLANLEEEVLPKA